MELIYTIFDFFLHLDKHLFEIVNDYRNWTYLILFLIIFMETGLIVTPFLPGDSLLFAAGTLAALGLLNIWLLLGLLCVAAFVGDSVNFSVGKFFGQKIFERKFRLIKREHLDRTHQFYEKHGGKTIIIARFIPIIRTFAPFIAGVGNMHYGRFITFNLGGGVLWVVLFSMGGYFFGNIPIVKNNFSVTVVAIILISLLPMVIEFIKYKLSPGKTS